MSLIAHRHNSARSSNARLAALRALFHYAALRHPEHAQLICTGKGRKERCVPLTSANVAILNTWCRERGGSWDDSLFPTRTGRRLSDDAVAARLALYRDVAAQGCPSLQEPDRLLAFLEGL